jgi:hypothetical protein
MKCLTKRRTIYVLLFSIFFYTSSFSRDINLDEIYINPSSTVYTRLIQKKSTNYKIINANLKDRNVIFSGWLSPSSLIYVKEFKSIDRNYVYITNLNDSNKRKIIELDGALIYVKLSKNGVFLICKSLKHKGNAVFENKIQILDLRNNTLHIRESNSVFTDFTTSYHGDSIYYEKSNGIISYDPKNKKETLFIPKIRYKSLIDSDHITLCYVSPKKNKIILLNGGGGSYKGFLYSNGNYSHSISGITSSREIFWLDNTSIVFRSGYLGNYSVKLYNTGNKQYKTILDKSLNTNITDSTYSKHITYVKDGILYSYNVDNKSNSNMLIEGEDALYSPLGDFISILHDSNLYVFKISQYKSNKILIRRNIKNILDIYKTIVGNNSIQLNEYSAEYINRKIQIYQNISR